MDRQVFSQIVMVVCSWRDGRAGRTGCCGCRPVGVCGGCLKGGGEERRGGSGGLTSERRGVAGRDDGSGGHEVDGWKDALDGFDFQS